ncbi:protein of unknown function DUF82 [Caldithrix abyssi DSM 13497]|uniref:Mut7-C RNAse domain-containing protein n=1 Tax=Caldithrix abyssi DSM 13497 TaxID=880073 RepID=H1XS68_CALAY|nr:DUF5615 family PIN-like protein [Caldithrix abyssi]APF20170.1 Mut7-C RNAse domain-containing protein [Caldithrix abyssi DSM 13497]EHO40232.1 protein of unknown function DUF82 [Caldithrix abyssi DSM 13497]
MKIKFIADVNVEKDIVDFLNNQGFDVLWIPDYNCKLQDDELLFLANKEGRVLITNDKDFGEIVFYQRKVSKGIILLRIKGQDVNKKLKVLKKLIDLHLEEIELNFIVLSDKKIRIRPLGDIK